MDIVSTRNLEKLFKDYSELTTDEIVTVHKIVKEAFEEVYTYILDILLYIKPIIETTSENALAIYNEMVPYITQMIDEGQVALEVINDVILETVEFSNEFFKIFKLAVKNSQTETCNSYLYYPIEKKPNLSIKHNISSYLDKLADMSENKKIKVIFAIFAFAIATTDSITTGKQLDVMSNQGTTIINQQLQLIQQDKESNRLKTQLIEQNDELIYLESQQLDVSVQQLDVSVQILDLLSQVFEN